MPDTSFLELAEEKIVSGRQDQIRSGFDLIINELAQIRQQLPAREWKRFAEEDCRNHSIIQVLQQDPLIWRSLHQPRGYAGDGELIDFMFAVEDGFTPPALQQATPLGQKIHLNSLQEEGPRAVRSRRRVIVEKINQLAQHKPDLQILALACGHLREAKYITALQTKSLGRFIAVDHDKNNLAVVDKEFGPSGVETVVASLRDIIRGHLIHTNFDFIYSAGLFDYLSLPTAQRVTEILFNKLNPGGHLLVANYVPNIRSVGFLEAFMNWWLVYRSRPELLAVSDTLPSRQIRNYNVSMDECQYIAILDIERK
ncbi:class I SAM-dependent methyltransferase [Dictyobacter arantiisoli]|uniref:Tellurite resistance methyltransferase TehB-like domain-containing protein n=1 Tax=Dictyobacter arantiisoli TaxID=2014874 RepID=A0A5A5T830_9CHLR|nr:class I SAM-dependent methyltransferase [Dictyobacter arantiisoli]GCF07558.1 hypothetical protein KDI_11220 [Dictyobacter arantiisoli]